jgi:hypothetical protein
MQTLPLQKWPNASHLDWQIGASSYSLLIRT